MLSSPDKRRVEPQPFDGRRIQKVDDGWLILNAEKYRAMIAEVKAEHDRMRKREWAKKNRLKKKAGGGTLEERNFTKRFENGETE